MLCVKNSFELNIETENECDYKNQSHIISESYA